MPITACEETSRFPCADPDGLFAALRGVLQHRNEAHRSTQPYLQRCIAIPSYRCPGMEACCTGPSRTITSFRLKYVAAGCHRRYAFTYCGHRSHLHRPSEKEMMTGYLLFGMIAATLSWLPVFVVRFLAGGGTYVPAGAPNTSSYPWDTLSMRFLRDVPRDTATPLQESQNR